MHTATYEHHPIPVGRRAVRALRPAALALIVALTLAAAGSAAAATLAPALAAELPGLTDGAAVGTVIVAFTGDGPLDAADLGVLQAAGVTAGLTLPELAMVAVPAATAGQVRALAGAAGVRSIWPNERLDYHIHQARVLAGVDELRADPATIYLNGGLPVSGSGNFSVVINDSGIDGTHGDLPYPTKVVQNVQVLTDTETQAGFTPLLTVEGVPNTDSHVGHGTHVAGIVGGTGLRSGGTYQGVAPGAKLIGTGSGAGLFILNALGGFEWSLANQFLYSVRVISNSWGSTGGFDPDDPVQIATRKASDRNIVVVFSAGNSGPSTDTHNRYGKAPWVISVAAGTKEGGLVDFSSRGTPWWERLGDADPANDFDAPTLTAPGTGREFDGNADRFTSDIVSTRSTSNVVANGLDADLEIPPPFLPFYTQISGTSMACPFVAGVVALLLEADPTLTPDEVKQILTTTATPMPGYLDHEVGAGYVNARAAVDLAFHRERGYGPVAHPDLHAELDVTPAAAPQPFSLDFDYVDPANNVVPFEVGSEVGILQVRIDFGTATAGEGNVFFLTLTAPDGTETTVGPSLPELTPAHLEALVRNPQPGSWTAEVSAGYVEGVVPATVPETVSGAIKRFHVAFAEPADLVGHPAESTLVGLLLERRMDTLADGGFHPDDPLTRGDFARTLALDTPLRQVLGGTPRFTDVSAELRPFAEAVTASGPTLRDFDFANGGLLSAAGVNFQPAATVDRLAVAVALVKALGHDADARAAAGSVVTWEGKPLSDNAQIPAAQRGYVQLALDLGLLAAFPAEVVQIGPGQYQVVPGPRFEPRTVVTRAGLALTLPTFAELFASGA